MKTLQQELEGHTNELEEAWKAWETSAKPTVADEIIASRMPEYRRIHRAAWEAGTEPVMLTNEQLEERARREYDAALAVEAGQLETLTAVTLDQIERGIVEAEELKPLSAVQTGTTNELLARVLEEQQTARLRQELATMTIGTLSDTYAGWTDERDQTAVRLVEQTVLGGRLEALGLRPDPTQDAVDLPKLKQAIAARRATRPDVAARMALRERGRAVRTLSRQELARHLRDERRGIASRPRLVTRGA